MKTIFAALVATLFSLTSTFALADSDKFQGGFNTGSFSASGFVGAPQAGEWSVGAMNQSFGTAGVNETKSGFKIDTSTGSMTEGFGSNFRGGTAAGGAGFGKGWGQFRGRF